MNNSATTHHPRNGQSNRPHLIDRLFPNNVLLQVPPSGRRPHTSNPRQPVFRCHDPEKVIRLQRHSFTGPGAERNIRPG